MPIGPAATDRDRRGDLPFQPDRLGGMLVMALAPRAMALPVLVGGQMLFGFGIALFNLQSLSLRQAITPPGLLGRVNAVVRLVGWCTVPVGGWLGGVVGLREVLVGCGVASMLTSAVPLLSQVPPGPRDARHRAGLDACRVSFAPLTPECYKQPLKTRMVLPPS
jgi:hypothetical protein